MFNASRISHFILFESSIKWMNNNGYASVIQFNSFLYNLVLHTQLL